MEWLNSLTYNKKLKISFILYMIIFLVLGLCFSKITEIFAERYISNINDSHLIEEKFEQDGKIMTYYKLSLDKPSELEQRVVKVLEEYSRFSLIVNVFIFSILGFFTFFDNKIKSVINEMEYMEISEDTLYKDEMLQLSANYTNMMDSLKLEKEKMWRGVNEMEKMMALFEHDIRTPITVIRGHKDMLLKYYPEGKISEEKLYKTLQSIGLQVDRLDQYVQRRNRIKNIRELEIHIESVEMQAFLRKIEKIGEVLAKDKQFIMRNHVSSKYLNLDENMVLEIVDNILANGLRYAKDLVETTVTENETHLIISIQDDGEGFSKEGLQYGTTAFFTENSSKGENKGLGLYISQVLCEKHQSELNVSNNTKGGLVEIKLKK